MADIMRAVATLAWPLLVVVILIYLLPAVRRLLRESHSVDVEVGGARVSVQTASNETRKLIEDLQDRVNELSALVDRGQEPSVEPMGSHPAPRGILWVDDEPGGNLYERARATDGGYEVVQATSTETALKLLEGMTPTVIVSDVGRTENGRFNPTAGLDLVRELRRRGDLTPVVFYTSPRGVALVRHDAELLTNVSCTASPTELARILDM
ncbi:response regulator [Micromonospora sp. WMMA1998]|uniref:response regulator n=1 Tax=Micromonospora sp. WMMA1998 TaxID=3015167 RepID=UPI00248AC7E6|nr:response regulator [Micromonospora sp. WMMA1998]WBC16991.1 response regulator [Micromonospora sp. WMMA1998]